MSKLPLLALAAPLALAGAIGAVPAAAEEDGIQRVAVDYGDLDLATSKGRDRLTMRVERAARTVCNVRQSQTLRGRLESRRCETQAMRNANVKLASLFNGTGTRVANNGSVSVVAP